MAESLEKHVCPYCRSSKITLDTGCSILTCNSCGGRWPLAEEPIRAGGTPFLSSAGTTPTTLIEGEKTEITRFRMFITPEVLAEVSNLRTEVNALKATVSEIKTELEGAKRDLAEEIGVVEVKEMTIEEARPLVEEFLRKYLEENKHVYPSDVADELGLKYELVKEIFDILEKEDRLKKRGG
ncbi:hypothetical protein MUP77_00010 [Candidatus Bathyarchaeota archaeon]|nr:hypothetical protein [Candidatus Bathyarchaeota archaeon]